MDAPVLLAQLTDCHVVGPQTASELDDELVVDNDGRLAAAVARIQAESPSMTAVLATGDLTYDGRPSEYDTLASLLAPLEIPVLPIPGNHDDRAGIRATFPDVPWVDTDHASWITTVGDGIRVVGLDSTDPGRPGGEFDAGREAWLRSVLGARHDGITLLAIHHPPFPTGIAWMDRSGFAGLDRLRSTLADHPVDRVLCGHLHRPITSSIAGIPAQVGIATVQHVHLDLAADAGVSLIDDPVGYLVHRINGGDVVTHTRYIGPAEEPYRPSWAADYE